MRDINRQRIGNAPWHKIGAIHYHTQLGLPEKILLSFVCYLTWYTEVFGRKRRDWASLSYNTGLLDLTLVSRTTASPVWGNWQERNYNGHKINLQSFFYHLYDTLCPSVCLLPCAWWRLKFLLEKFSLLLNKSTANYFLVYTRVRLDIWPTFDIRQITGYPAG